MGTIYCEHGTQEWREKLLLTKNNSEIWYTLEIHLNYPRELHDCYKALPSAVEDRMKLVTKLKNTDKYDIHNRNLKQC